jgi:hypothetical protein
MLTLGLGVSQEMLFIRMAATRLQLPLACLYLENTYIIDQQCVVFVFTALLLVCALVRISFALEMICLLQSRLRSVHYKGMGLKCSVLPTPLKPP